MTNFVPAEAPAVAVPEKTFRGVGAEWLHNLGVAIGVWAVLVGGRLLLHWIGVLRGWWDEGWPAQMWAYMGLALAVAMVVFGIIQALRASLDEIDRLNEWYHLDQRIAELEGENLELDGEIARLRQELTEARFVSVRVRRPDVVAVDIDVEREEVSDARTLIQRWGNNVPWTRDQMIEICQWTAPRWVAARQILIDAGVVVAESRQTRWLAKTVDEAYELLAVATGVEA